MKRLNVVLEQVNEGETFKDKLVIFSYWFSKIFFKNPQFLSDVTLKNSAGRFFCSRNPSYLGSSVENYEPEVQEHLKLKEGVFIDIGAFTGRYTIEIGNSLKKGKVISVEPNRDNFKILQKNILINHLENTIALNIACSDRKGKAN